MDTTEAMAPRVKNSKFPVRWFRYLNIPILEVCNPMHNNSDVDMDVGPAGSIARYTIGTRNACTFTASSRPGPNNHNIIPYLSPYFLPDQ